MIPTRLAFGAAFACATLLAAPADAAPRGDPLKAGEPVADVALAAMRGGFETSGMEVSFGIERAVYINGQLVASTRLDVSTTGSMNVTTNAAAGAALLLVQRGPNNAFDAVATTGAAMVVQNSLDNQAIVGLTRIDATVGSLDAARRSGLQSSILDAVAGSIRH